MFVFEAMSIDGQGEQKNEIEKKRKKERNSFVSHLYILYVDLVFLSHNFAKERLKTSRKVICIGVKILILLSVKQVI